MRQGAQTRGGRNQHQRAVSKQLAEIAQVIADPLRGAGLLTVVLQCEGAEEEQDQRRHDHARHDVDDHHRAPAECGKQRTGDQWCQRFADVAAHAMQ